MSVYFVVTYDITDPAAYEPYVPGVMPLLQKHGAEVLVADGEAKALEGEQRQIVVVLRFESEEKADAWYNDPEGFELRDTVARFAAAELPEVARACEAEHEPVGPEVLARFAALGLLGLNLPAEYGGGGQSHANIMPFQTISFIVSLYGVYPSRS